MLKSIKHFKKVLKNQSLTLKSCKSILKMQIIINVYLESLKMVDNLMIYDLESKSIPKSIPKSVWT